MSDTASTNFNKAQAAPQILYKLCLDCRATLPTSDFGLARRYKDGLSPCCKLCRSEYNSFSWTKKYGRRFKLHSPEIIRNVQTQNSHVISVALAVTQMEVCAFNPETKMDYKVFFGKSDRLGLQAVTIFNLDGSVFFEYAYSGLTQPLPTILNWIKGFNLRLELSQIDMMMSKKTIYYI